MDFTKQINDYLQLEMETIRRLDLAELNSGINEIVSAFRRDGTIYIFGNGGSAATASHFANDFNKGVSEYTEQKFRFVCLNDNVATIMAIANDYCYEEIFVRQLQGRLRAEDLVIGISGSGNSMNIVNALSYAKDIGVRTLGITGYDGGKVRQIADASMHVPLKNMQITEDLHMVFDHMMMTILKEALQ